MRDFLYLRSEVEVLLTVIYRTGNFQGRGVG